MNGVDREIIEQFDEMIELGRRVISSGQKQEFGMWYDPEFLAEWLTRGLGLLERVFDPSNQRCHTFRSNYGQHVGSACGSPRGMMGVMVGAKRDYERGYLFNLKAQLLSEVFDDQLAQAEYFLEAADTNQSEGGGQGVGDFLDGVCV